MHDLFNNARGDPWNRIDGRLWVDPENDIVGVYLSVVTELAADERQIMNADRFINVVTSAVEG